MGVTCCRRIPGSNQFALTGVEPACRCAYYPIADYTIRPRRIAPSGCAYTCAPHWGFVGDADLPLCGRTLLILFISISATFWAAYWCATCNAMINQFASAFITKIAVYMRQQIAWFINCVASKFVYSCHNVTSKNKSRSLTCLLPVADTPSAG